MSAHPINHSATMEDVNEHSNIQEFVEAYEIHISKTRMMAKIVWGGALKLGYKQERSDCMFVSVWRGCKLYNENRFSP